ncbi:hypothetical protein NQZ68_032167 [Dissostichus eleginoides]|nr:hypothetical protein NQZ68_032167 [Dissostichus eleginoides]
MSSILYVKQANRKKKDKRKTGGGPPPADFTPAEELALSNNEGRPLMVGVEGGVSTDPGGSRSHRIQDDGDNMVLLPPPKSPTTSYRGMAE